MLSSRSLKIKSGSRKLRSSRTYTRKGSRTGYNVSEMRRRTTSFKAASVTR